MREALHLFGPQKNLVGIASIPAEQNQTVGVLLLNAGVVHKVGPFNLNVEFSRFLANRGFLAFRFDTGGLGDSRKIKSNLSHHESILQDISEAISVLCDQYQLQRVVVLGLCTGAENAFKAALHDERVVGSVLLDGYGYETKKHKWNHIRDRVFDPKRIFNFVLRKLGLKKSNVKASNDLNADQSAENPADLDAELQALEEENRSDYIWTLPEKSAYQKDMAMLYQRGVKFLHIYSGGVYSYYSYKDQFRDSFKDEAFLQCVDVEWYPQADHTYKILKDREAMMLRVGLWLESTCVDTSR